MITELKPEPASSSCGRTRAETPPRHPRGGCGPDSAGFQCRVPEDRRWHEAPEGGGEGGRRGGWVRAALPPQVPESWPYLDVLSEAVEDLFSYRHGFGEVPLALLIDDILARVVPVEVTDGFLWGQEAGGIMEPRAVPLASDSGRTRLASLPHLQPQEIVHCTDDYVDGGRISGLCP